MIDHAKFDRWATADRREYWISTWHRSERQCLLAAHDDLGVPRRVPEFTLAKKEENENEVRFAELCAMAPPRHAKPRP
nr:unnamed protein product [Haemonchus contortus]